MNLRGEPAPVELEEIWRRFDAPLRAFVSRRVRSRDAVDDIVQDVYLRIHGAIGGLRNPARIDAWIFQIARNLVVDYFRRTRESVELDEGFALEETDREDTRFEVELNVMVRQMVERLSPLYRQALRMVDLEGRRQVDAARELGISASGMKSRVQRGRRALKELLLDCCHFELDRRGQVIDYQPRCRCCRAAG